MEDDEVDEVKLLMCDIEVNAIEVIINIGIDLLICECELVCHEKSRKYEYEYENL